MQTCAAPLRQALSYYEMRKFDKAEAIFREVRRAAGMGMGHFLRKNNGNKWQKTHETMEKPWENKDKIPEHLQMKMEWDRLDHFITGCPQHFCPLPQHNVERPRWVCSLASTLAPSTNLRWSWGDAPITTSHWALIIAVGILGKNLAAGWLQMVVDGCRWLPGWWFGCHSLFSHILGC